MNDLAAELPLEIRLNGEPVAVTMRTPGHDDELAAGFLAGEGLHVRSAGPTEDFAANIVDVAAEGALPARSFYTTSSCGICGKGALEQVAVHAARVAPGPEVDAGLLASLPDRLDQPGFRRTGGMHATGLFTPDGALLLEREDVGRHNAMDKVIGARALAGELPLAGLVLVVTGRLAFELVQKAAVAGCPVLVGVGAPTSLAVELAADRGMTLCGFARGESVEVYAGAERVLGAVAAGAS